MIDFFNSYQVCWLIFKLLIYSLKKKIGLNYSCYIVTSEIPEVDPLYVASVVAIQIDDFFFIIYRLFMFR